MVKVQKIIFPVDFVVINMEEDEQIPLFLSRLMSKKLIEFLVHFLNFLTI